MSGSGAAEALGARLSAWRRRLHRYPELAFEETRTAAFVAETLRGVGLGVQTGVGKTGVVALVEGRAPGPTVALRADMDALPVQDEKSAPYASAHPGKMHGCGHDAHTAMLLGAAHLLAARPPGRGNVKLIFQPAEEGLAGAAAIIADGVLSGPEVAAIFAIHVHPTVEVGYASVCPGQSSAASDTFDLTIVGEGGHAAHPHLSVDAITVAAAVVTALQQLVSRQTNPLHPLVITVGKIAGGAARNVIAPSVRLEGTVRSLHPELRERVPVLLERLVRGVCEAFGADYRLEYRHGYPSVYNDPALLPFLEAATLEVLGPGRLSVREPSLGGEDFAYYTQRVPGLIFRLGTRGDDESTRYPLHHPKFDLDEAALPLGSALHAELAYRYLEGASSL
ncbi:M20 metallopeptidase family protein [Truepera radiovictrix]|uniref:Amidohydrolase n=1 Tax=Truepera radiovictrix (strain DSM 17093 / CIP 108686 / LMG 22925 / RQ-24) TaxID=649638 RepID=D7CUT6_TRURR|nr:M20 family metallopeptidase [Truepera radiovictrix]ADI14077.1 amidohydrolase [Truepera radiovictrix DSM 17093]WMT57361.1 M20 family metallopeptidase [Truepera radiovictrix]